MICNNSQNNKKAGSQMLLAFYLNNRHRF